MTRVEAFSLSRLLVIVLIVAAFTAIGMSFITWLSSLKVQAAERIDSHAQQLEVRVS